MKKIFILIILLTLCVTAREEAPILPLDRGVDIKYSDNNLDLIDTEGMRRKKSVEKAKDEYSEKPLNPIQVDTRYLKQQRALDYVSNPFKYMMPPVL